MTAGVELWLLAEGEGVDLGLNLARSFLYRLGMDVIRVQLMSKLCYNQWVSGRKIQA